MDVPEDEKKTNMTTPTAIITGATSGIGAAYAKALAQKGWNLIITGRRENRLKTIKKDLSDLYPIHIQTVKADLLNPDDINHFLQVIDQTDHIELLINSAGFGFNRNFFENEYDIQLSMMQIHINATTKIVHHVVPHMIKNGKGNIINIASLSAFLPAPLSYCYNASKAFLVTFSECLYLDLSSKNIKVQVLCPGLTKTEFHSKQGIHNIDNNFINRLMWLSADQVVNKSLNALRNGKIIVIPGFVNRFIYFLTKIIPKRIYYKIAVRRSEKINQQLLSAA